MSVTIKGHPGIVRKHDTRKFVPGVGWEHTVRFEGVGRQAEKSCYAVARAFADAGYVSEISPVGDTPGWSLVCVGANAGDGSPEEPVERWSWRKEFVQQSIWQHPDVLTEQAAWILYMDQTDPGNDLLSKGYKADIEDAVENSRELDQTLFPVGVFPVANWVFMELKRGADSFEISVPVLSVQRTTYPTSVNKIKIGTLETVYSSSALISHLATLGMTIPQEVLDVLPGTAGNPAPADPPETRYAWKERDNQGSIENGFRHMQQIEWVFAAWSTNLYDHV